MKAIEKLASNGLLGYVVIFIYIYTYVCVHVRACIHAYVHVCVHGCVCVCLSVHMRVCVCMLREERQKNTEYICVRTCSIFHL